MEPNKHYARAGAARFGRRQALLLIGGMVLVACGREVRYSQPEPGFLRYHADDVIQVFQAAGLPVTEVTPRPIATATPIPNVERQPKIKEPMIEAEARDFLIPGLAGKGGSIFVFDSSERLHAKRVWFARFPDRYPYAFAHANVLVNLDQSLPPEQAQRYQQALETLP